MRLSDPEQKKFCAYVPDYRKEITPKANRKAGVYQDEDVQLTIQQQETEGTSDTTHARELLMQATNAANNIPL